MKTLVCRRCYEKMAQKPYDISCFGKPTIVHIANGGTKKRKLGFDTRASECMQLCPDRQMCSFWIAKETR